MSEPVMPPAAEVGLDLHMLRHDVIEAAKRWAGVAPASDDGEEQHLLRTLDLLRAAEEEHAKIVATNGPPSECPSIGTAQPIGCTAVEMGLECIVIRHSVQHPHIAFCDDGRIQIWQTGEWTSRLPVKAEGRASKPENPEAEERPADNSPAYQQKRCSYFAAQLRDASINVQVAQTDSEAERFKKLLWDAAYWLDRVGGR